MRLALLTNMPSQHQAELGAALCEILGADNFRLVFEHPTSDAREEMGWVDRFRAPYILRLWEGEAVNEEVDRWIDEADVVVQGRFPMSRVRARIHAGKLTLAYQERFWKRPFNVLRLVARLPRIYRRYWSVNKPNYHLLAAGAYVASDLAKIGMFKQRAWKFGYFMNASSAPAVKQSKDSLQLLWCARFSRVKRASDAFQIVRELLDRRVPVELTMIGDGELRAEAEEACDDIRDHVSFLGWQPAEVVADQMAKSDVFLMTSGFGEGWAMVINEAQNAGCMVVANREIGAAPWLIQHRESGLLYYQHNISELADELAQYSRERITQMGISGQRSHAECWSAEPAAERLVALSRYLLQPPKSREQAPFAQGPCSAA